MSVSTIASAILYTFFFFKQKTAYEVRISDWSSDVCSSDLGRSWPAAARRRAPLASHGDGVRATAAPSGCAQTPATAVAWRGERRGRAERTAPARRRLVDRKSTRLNSSH